MRDRPAVEEYTPHKHPRIPEGPTFHELMVFIMPLAATFAAVLGFIAFVVVRYL